MALTPIDVQQKTFKISLRGYAEDEVDEFLDEVVISLRDLEQQLRDAEERVSIVEDQLEANRETEDAMRRTFVVAQRTADTIVSEAQEEADRILARGDLQGEPPDRGAARANENASSPNSSRCARNRAGSAPPSPNWSVVSSPNLEALDERAVGNRLRAIIRRDTGRSVGRARCHVPAHRRHGGDDRRVRPERRNSRRISRPGPG